MRPDRFPHCWGLPPIGIHLAGGPWRELFVPALLLGFIVFLQSMSAAQALIELNRTLGLQGVKLHLTEAKAPVLDRLGRTPLLQELGGQVFHRAVQAFDYLAKGGD